MVLLLDDSDNSLKSFFLGTWVFSLCKKLTRELSALYRIMNVV